jgi:hypothetical protein
MQIPCIGTVGLKPLVYASYFFELFYGGGSLALTMASTFIAGKMLKTAQAATIEKNR